jgi:pyruvate-ferredoxin/flavodoxin oxidoreductase
LTAFAHLTVTKISQLTDDDLHSIIDEQLIRARGLSPEHRCSRHPKSDVYFQARAVSPPTAPSIVQDSMDKFGSMTGRKYKLLIISVIRRLSGLVIGLSGKRLKTVDSCKTG